MDKNVENEIKSSSTLIKDFKSVKEWLGADKIKVRKQQVSIENYKEEIDEMESSYIHFPKDEQRTSLIYDILKAGGAIYPVWVDESDNFILEGRHRIVAFYWYGLKEIPTFFCSPDN